MTVEDIRLWQDSLRGIVAVEDALEGDDHDADDITPPQAVVDFLWSFSYAL